MLNRCRRLTSQFPAVQIVTNAAPKGFAANHNAVIRTATTPYILLLNDDALLSPHALDHMLDYLEAHSDCGIVGPVIHSPDGTLQISAFSDPTLARMIYQVSGVSRFTKQGGLVREVLQTLGITRQLRIESLNTSLSTRIVPVVVGVCMAVRREAVQQAGMMDEDTLIYGEEFGWQLRLREHGWKAALVGEAEVVHLNPSQDLSGWKLAEHRKGMLNYFIRYRPRWQAWVLRGALVVFHGMVAAAWLPFNRARALSHWKVCQVGWNWHPAQ